MSDIHIHCILHDPSKTFFALCGQGMQDFAREQGIALSIHPAYTDADHAAELEMCLRKHDVDAVILGGGDFASISAAASSTRLPVISCVGAGPDVPFACDVQPDFYRAATLAATHLVERLNGCGAIIHIKGRADSPATYPRTQGFDDVIARHPQITLVAAEHGNWDRASSAQIIQAALPRHPDLQAVFAHSDEMALGTADALNAAGRADVLVAGIDAIPEALMAIHMGQMTVTVDLAPYAIGRTALTHALQIIQGHSAPAIVQTEVRLVTGTNLLDTALPTLRVLPTILRDLVEGNKAQRRLQDEIIATQQALIRELSTPIIPVSAAILVAPLIGTIDTRRARQITAAVLEAASQKNTQVLIIDITGVAVVDTSVINHLLQMARAVRLLGTQVLLVGVSPEVAQTIVQLGIDLSSIVTRSTLQAGLEYAVTI
jgi:ribose transport system substrate-binding protein